MMRISDFCQMEFVDGVVHAHYIPYAFVDIDVAKEIVVVRKKLVNHKPHPVVVTGGPINISPEARKYAFTPESSELITSWAIVSDQNWIKTNFYKLLFFTQNRKRKLRFFNKKEDALEWIHSRKISGSDFGLFR